MVANENEKLLRTASLDKRRVFNEVCSSVQSAKEVKCISRLKPTYAKSLGTFDGVSEIEHMSSCDYDVDISFMTVSF